MIPYINSRTFGSGPRSALAIHCTLAHSGAWRGIAAALDDLLNLHAFDLPFHGKSGDWDGQGDMHDTATAMARALLDGMGPGPHDLIGHSFGATVALRLAVEDPDRVRTLVMFEPVFMAPAMTDDPGFAGAYKDLMHPFFTALEAGDHMLAARLFNRAWGDHTTWDAIPENTRQYMADRIHFVRASTPFLEDDSTGLLAPGAMETAAMPALLLRGDLSDWAAPTNAAIARRLPKATELALPGVGHMAPITAPKKVAGALRAFLSHHP